ncbi:hypothetical protein SSTU70S_05583 [Stutzerimonas stutzeri]
MRYILSVAQHLFTGKLTFAHALYALRVRPIAVVSKGKTWVIEPDFEVGDNAPASSPVQADEQTLSKP